MEELYAYLLLWEIGFCFGEKYNLLLDQRFAKSPDDLLLLELEEKSAEPFDGLQALEQHFGGKCAGFDKALFVKSLFSGLKAAYDEKRFDFTDYVNLCAKLWHRLPEEIQLTEPFCILNHSDDLLMWGEEAKIRELFEKTFEAYGKDMSM